MQTLVIRFSSLGDVVLAGAVTGALAPVTFLTAPAFADVARRLPGVQEVVRWGLDPLPERFDRVIDLHASPRSRLVTARLRAPVVRVARHDLRRRLRVWLKAGAPPPTVVERYATAAGVPPAPAPWIGVDGPAHALVLCPGASWPTKRWPAERWVELGRRWPGPIVVLGGPDEGALVRGVANALGPRAEAVCERGFQRTFEAIGRGRVAVAGDTGLLHLCAAAGVPVVGLFGPTTSSDGFWVHPGRAVELDLECRPCSRYGSRSCPVGDHLCLDGIDVDAAWRAVGEVVG